MPYAASYVPTQWYGPLCFSLSNLNWCAIVALLFCMQCYGPLLLSKPHGCMNGRVVVYRKAYPLIAQRSVCIGMLVASSKATLGKGPCELGSLVWALVVFWAFFLLSISAIAFCVCFGFIWLGVQPGQRLPVLD